VPLAVEGTIAAVNLGAQAVGWYSGLTGGAGVVLGKYPAYLEAAEEMGANVFNLSKNLYNVLDRMGASWTANQAFLDASIFRGQQFYVSSVAASGSYWMELQYLTSKVLALKRGKAPSSSSEKRIADVQTIKGLDYLLNQSSAINSGVYCKVHLCIVFWASRQATRPATARSISD
jgi:hypothetical protein